MDRVSQSPTKTKIPTTAAERQQLHARLYQFATDARDKGLTKGLKKFVQSFCDQRFEATLIYWLETYAPIRQHLRGPNNEWQFDVARDIQKGYDLAGAKLNPYYSIDPVKICQAPIKHPPKAQVYETPPHSANQASDRQMAVKRLKLAVKEFLDEGTRESKSKLIQLINDFPSKAESVRRSPFFQGGAPGLKR